MKKSMQKAYDSLVKKQDGGKVEKRKPIKEIKDKMRDIEKEEKEKSFKRDSTNLDNATERYLKAMNKKDGASMADYIQGSDSLRAISKRREGDKEFWERMNPKKKKGGLVIAVGKMPKGKCKKGGKVKQW